MAFDLATFISAVGVAGAGAAWLSKQIVSQTLSKELEAEKGNIRKEVELTLREHASQLDYDSEAKKRLYNEIGPLRFQLLLACRDLSGRVSSFANRPYETNLSGYFGRTTLYRILRPIAISELIERKIALADFSIDRGAVDLLRFKKSAYAAFSGQSVVGDHPDLEWEHEVQHVFFDSLSKCANAIITSENENLERVMRFHEFEDLAINNSVIFMPFPKLLSGFTPDTKPILWIRLVAYGNLCNQFINKTGDKVGFEVRQYPIEELIHQSEDTEIKSKKAYYIDACAKLPDSPL